MLYTPPPHAAFQFAPQGVVGDIVIKWVDQMPTRGGLGHLV